MAEAAAAAGVTIVTGDTKVVGRGAADGCYVTTRGVGVVPGGALPRSRAVRPGDVVLVSGTHRRPRHGRDARPRRPGARGRHPLRHRAGRRAGRGPAGGGARHPLAARPDPRRARHGLQRAGPRPDLAVVLDETLLPVDPAVNGACDLLGIDPLYVANEGKVVAVVAPGEADAALAALRGHPLGARRRGSARSPPSPRASSCCSPPSAAPASSTCSSATRSPGSAEAVAYRPSPDDPPSCG